MRAPALIIAMMKGLVDSPRASWASRIRPRQDGWISHMAALRWAVVQTKRKGSCRKAAAMRAASARPVMRAITRVPGRHCPRYEDRARHVAGTGQPPPYGRAPPTRSSSCSTMPSAGLFSRFSRSVSPRAPATIQPARAVSLGASLRRRRVTTFSRRRIRHCAEAATLWPKDASVRDAVARPSAVLLIRFSIGSCRCKHVLGTREGCELLEHGASGEAQCGRLDGRSHRLRGYVRGERTADLRAERFGLVRNLMESVFDSQRLRTARMIVCTLAESRGGVCARDVQPGRGARIREGGCRMRDSPQAFGAGAEQVAGVECGCSARRASKRGQHL